MYPGTSIDTIIAYFFTSQFVTQIFMKSINFHIRCIIQSLLTLVGRCARYSGVMYLSLMLGTLVTLFSVSSTVITAASCSSESHLTLASVPCIVTLCSHCARCCVRQVTEPSPQSHSATRPAQTGPGQGCTGTAG